MDKNNAKKSNSKPIDRVRALLVRKFAIEYNRTEQSIRTIINGFGKGEDAPEIKAHYEKEYKALCDMTKPNT